MEHSGLVQRPKDWRDTRNFKKIPYMTDAHANELEVRTCTLIRIVYMLIYIREFTANTPPVGSQVVRHRQVVVPPEPAQPPKGRESGKPFHVFVPCIGR